MLSSVFFAAGFACCSSATVDVSAVVEKVKVRVVVRVDVVEVGMRSVSDGFVNFFVGSFVVVVAVDVVVAVVVAVVVVGLVIHCHFEVTIVIVVVEVVDW